MKLKELFAGDKQIVDTSGKGASGAVSQGSVVNRQIHSFVPGQTLQGELIARNGNEVQIKLSDDIVIKARLDQNMNLEIGRTLTFEVKNNGQALLLSPLYANVATDANVLKALDMASLPINQNTVEMTELLMKAGLSIDRNSLQQVFRECNQFSSAGIENIMDLHKLAMPVNEGNLSQLESYKNLTYQLVKGMNNCLEVLPDTIQGMLQAGDRQGAENVMNQLFSMLQEGGVENGEGQPTPTGSMGGTLLQTADGQLFVLPKLTDMQPKFLEFPGDQALLQQLVEGEGGKLLQAVLQNGDEQLLQGLANGDEGELQQLLSKVSENDFGQRTDMSGEAVTRSSAQGSEVQQLQTFLQNGGRQLLQSLLQNPDKQLFQLLTGSEKGQIRSLEGFLKEAIGGQWTISPEEVADPEKLKQLYVRMDKQLKGLGQVLETVNQTGSEAYKAVSTMSQNLDFLQQVNQAYTFLQLPLRLQQGRDAHGELFVYTNKKHLATRDGQVSALLHLDMEHLGPVDVYVAMQNENVNTQFYLQDEELLDFMYGHIDILTERLRARGYSCNCEMKTRGTESGGGQNGGIKQLLGQDMHIPIVQYAFDVRT